MRKVELLHIYFSTIFAFAFIVLEWSQSNHSFTTQNKPKLQDAKKLNNNQLQKLYLIVTREHYILFS